MTPQRVVALSGPIGPVRRAGSPDDDEFGPAHLHPHHEPHRVEPCRELVDPARLGALAPGLDVTELEHALAGLRRSCTQRVPGREKPGQRFGWLAAPRSTVLQPGPMHGGVTSDPAAELDRLMDRLVG